MTFINNNKDPFMNRGVQLILRRKTQRPKAFIFCFEKLLFLFNREINVYFNFSLDIRKSK